MHWHRTGLIAYKYKKQILINDFKGEKMIKAGVFMQTVSTFNK